MHERRSTSAVGQGYGFPLGELVPYLRSAEIRTPHNVFFFALGYTGWIGVALFFLFQFTLLQLLWRTYRITGQPYGIAAWVEAFAAAFFGNSFETPFGAIPLYLTLGLLIAPGIRQEHLADESSLSPQLVPAARW